MVFRGLISRKNIFPQAGGYRLYAPNKLNPEHLRDLVRI